MKICYLFKIGSIHLMLYFSALIVTSIHYILQNLKSIIILYICMPKHGNILRLMSFIVTVAIFFIFPPTQIYAGENVNWKTFNEKNGLFTIKYPSNWFPSKIDESTELINMFFAYQGHGSSFATLNLVGEENLSLLM